MKTLILVYPPFCTPASPPYSLANLSAFLRKNTVMDIKAIDLNLIFHELKFKKYGDYFKDFKSRMQDYDKISKQFVQETKDVYSENHKSILEGKNPELFDVLLENITKHKPDFVAFSLVYSSQAFYTSVLISELKRQNIKTIIGGPAVNSKVRADYVFNNEMEFLNFLNSKDKEPDYDYITDFSDFKLKDYFTPEPVIPIKTSSSCYYQGCSFCDHHKHVPYMEYDLDRIKKSLEASKAKYVFIVDDMISKNRCLKIAEMMKQLKIRWVCQLKPTKEYDKETLNILSESGLKIIMWGVESGSQRILNLMKKRTNTGDIENVLKASHLAGIKNIVYIMFGFPTETKEEFIETISLLKRNQEYISLVSTTVFGLQEGTDICNNPKEYGIKEIIKEKRTLLEEKISYNLDSGIKSYDAKLLRKRYKKTIDNLNKFPGKMNFFREHMLYLV
jgi:hypothetical protein